MYYCPQTPIDTKFRKNAKITEPFSKICNKSINKDGSLKCVGWKQISSKYCYIYNDMNKKVIWYKLDFNVNQELTLKFFCKSIVGSE